MCAFLKKERYGLSRHRPRPSSTAQHCAHSWHAGVSTPSLGWLGQAGTRPGSHAPTSWSMVPWSSVRPTVGTSQWLKKDSSGIGPVRRNQAPEAKKLQPWRRRWSRETAWGAERWHEG